MTNNTATHIWWDGPIDDAALALFHNMRTGYTFGYEAQLADEIIVGLTVQQRHNLLDLAVENKMLCLADGFILNECDQRSYDAVSTMAETLLDAIRARGQTRSASRSRNFVVSEICRRRDSLERQPEQAISLDATRVSALADEAIEDWNTFVAEVRDRTARTGR